MACAFSYEKDIQMIKNLLNLNPSFFIFISSWCVSWVDSSFFIDHYTRSKIDAERLIIDSGIPYHIYRPSLVFGNNKLLWQRNLNIFRLCVDSMLRLLPVQILSHKVQNSIVNHRSITNNIEDLWGVLY